MSAFVVGYDHIDGLMTYCLEGHRPYGVSYFLPLSGNRVEINRRNVEEIGRILLEENEASVSYRYPDDDPDDLPGSGGETAAGYRFCRFDGRLSPVSILKACDCLEYQSCEHPGWEGSIAQCIVRGIKDAAVSDLPGYDDAPGWGLRR